MSTWFNKVSSDISNIVPAIEAYEKELIDAKIQCRIRGSLEKASADLPGITEQRFNQLQEIEAILEYLNIKERKIRGAKFRQYLEHHNKTLTSRDADKYVDGDEEVISQALLINEFSLIRNQFLGIMKGLDVKQWQIGHITKLRSCGMEDIIID